MTELAATILVPAAATSAPALVLTAPISFWGGVDPASGTICDVRHPQHGVSITSKVLCLPGTIGSSSASSVLLELVRSGLAPAAMILHRPDAILLLGLVVAHEMGWRPPIAIQLDAAHFQLLAGRMVSVGDDGAVVSGEAFRS